MRLDDRHLTRIDLGVDQFVGLQVDLPEARADDRSVPGSCRHPIDEDESVEKLINLRNVHRAAEGPAQAIGAAG